MHGSLYVDDFVICYKSQNSVERQLQFCLHKIQNWADENGFKFSKTKTACVHFCTTRKPHNDPCLTFRQESNPSRKLDQILGNILDN